MLGSLSGRKYEESAHSHPHLRLSSKSHSHERVRISKTNELVPNPPAHQKWQRQFPVKMIPTYRENLAKLDRIVIEYGTEDTPANVSAGVHAFSLALASNGVPHKLEVYDGKLSSHIRDRLAKHVFPLTIVINLPNHTLLSTRFSICNHL
jgi:hypothetical protein